LANSKSVDLILVAVIDAAVEADISERISSMKASVSYWSFLKSVGSN
jgi:hypothetical protein